MKFHLLNGMLSMQEMKESQRSGGSFIRKVASLLWETYCFARGNFKQDHLLFKGRVLTTELEV